MTVYTWAEQGQLSTLCEGQPMRTQPYTRNYSKQRDTESRRNRLLQGKAQQRVIQYPVGSPENVHTRNIVRTEQVIFRNTHCVYMYVTVSIHACSNTQWKQRPCIWKLTRECGRVWREEWEEENEAIILHSEFFKIIFVESWARWLTPIIPTPRSMRQVDCRMFKASMGCKFQWYSLSQLNQNKTI